MQLKYRHRIDIFLALGAITFPLVAFVFLSSTENINEILIEPPGYLISGVVAPFVFGLIGVALRIETGSTESILIFIFFIGVIFFLIGIFMPEGAKKSAMYNLASALMGAGVGFLVGSKRGKEKG